MSIRTWAALLGLAAAAGCEGVEHRCTLRRCFSGASADFDVPVSYDVLRASSLQMCRNSECLTADFSTLPEAPAAPGTGTAIIVPSRSTAPRVEIDVFAQDSGVLRLQVAWITRSDADLNDGDDYAVALSDAVGSSVVSAHQRVVYAVTYPNGPECGYPCHNARLDVAPSTDGGAPP